MKNKLRKFWIDFKFERIKITQENTKYSRFTENPKNMKRQLELSKMNTSQYLFLMNRVYTNVLILMKLG